MTHNKNLIGRTVWASFDPDYCTKGVEGVVRGVAYDGCYGDWILLLEMTTGDAGALWIRKSSQVSLIEGKTIRGIRAGEDGAK